jgi:hypothetical protein
MIHPPVRRSQNVKCINVKICESLTDHNNGKVGVLGRLQLLDGVGEERKRHGNIVRNEQY